MTTMQTVEADELKAWMSANGWTVRTLTTALGFKPNGWRTVQRWRDGTADPPPYLHLALERLGRRIPETTTSDPLEIREEPEPPEEEITREPIED